MFLLDIEVAYQSERRLKKGIHQHWSFRFPVNYSLGSEEYIRAYSHDELISLAEVNCLEQNKNNQGPSLWFFLIEEISRRTPVGNFDSRNSI